MTERTSDPERVLPTAADRPQDWPGRRVGAALVVLHALLALAFGFLMFMQYIFETEVYGGGETHEGSYIFLGAACLNSFVAAAVLLPRSPGEPLPPKRRVILAQTAVATLAVLTVVGSVVVTELSR